MLPDDEAADVEAAATIAPGSRTPWHSGTPYRGVLYAGLMRTASGFKVIEYNARFGDPEAQVTLPRIGGDFGRLLVALGEGRLAEYVAKEPLRIEPRAYVSIAICADGLSCLAWRRRSGFRLDQLPEGVYAFIAGTRGLPNGGFATAGGGRSHRAAAATLQQKRARPHMSAAPCAFDGAFYRSDIAEREGEWLNARLASSWPASDKPVMSAAEGDP